MTNITLPISKPIVSCYPHHAFILSIISEKEECHPWIFSNYNNLFIDQAGFCDFVIKSPEYYLYPWFHGSERIHIRKFRNNKTSFLNLIKESLQEGYYVWLYVDEFYLSCSKHFKKTNYTHSTMIYGYDDKNFLLAGYYDQMKYSVSYVSSHELEEAFTRCSFEYDFHQYIHLIKFNNDYKVDKFEYNKALFKEQLCYHYTSTFAPLLNLEENYNFNANKKLITGINVYNVLKELYSSHFKKFDFDDHRPLYVLYEHKKIMSLRLRYLKKNGYIIFSKEIYEKYNYLENSSQNLLFLYLKFQLTKNNNISSKFLTALDELRKFEEILLKQIINEIDTK